MQEKYTKVIKNYFSDYFIWLLIIVFLMIVSLIAAFAFNVSNCFIWVLPFSFFIIFLLSLPLLVLYIKVKKDIKKHFVKKVVFKIYDLQIDDKYIFKNRGGTITGKAKYRIFDEDNNGYLLCASVEREPILVLDPVPDFSVEIEYLRTSKLVLSMKVEEKQPVLNKSRKQTQNISDFKRVFKFYF